MVSFGWGGWDRTSACGFQRPMPYHLATPQDAWNILRERAPPARLFYSCHDKEAFLFPIPII